MFLYQTITLIFVHCTVISFNNIFNPITPLFVSIISISHPVFMKTRLLYKANYISLRLCLRIPFKKGYISNQECTNFQELMQTFMLEEVVSLYCYFRKINFTKDSQHEMLTIFSRHAMLASIIVFHCVSDTQY